MKKSVVFSIVFLIIMALAFSGCSKKSAKIDEKGGPIEVVENGVGKARKFDGDLKTFWSYLTFPVRNGGPYQVILKA